MYKVHDLALHWDLFKKFKSIDGDGRTFNNKNGSVDSNNIINGRLMI